MEDSYLQQINHSSIHMKLYEHYLISDQSIVATELLRVDSNLVTQLNVYGSDKCLLLNLWDNEFNSYSTLPNVLNRLSDFLFIYNSGAYTNRGYLLPDIYFEKEGIQMCFDVLVVRLPNYNAMMELGIPEWVYIENLDNRVDFITAIANLNDYKTVGAVIEDENVITKLQCKGINRLVIQGGLNNGNC